MALTYIQPKTQVRIRCAIYTRKSTKKGLQEFGSPNKVWRTRTGRTRGGRVFDKPAVHSLLTSPLYVGKIAYKEHVYEGEQDAIIDQETFDAVGKML